MAHAVGVRATSLGAAALMLGAGLFSALNMTYQIVDWGAADPPPIEMAPLIPDPPPVTPPPRTHAPPSVPNEAEQMAAPDLPFTQFLDTDAAPQETAFVFTPPGPMEITAPDWIRRPRDLGAYYPRRALERGVEGMVQLDCIVALSGRLHCTVRSETPQNFGFAGAALRIAADHQMRPALRDGVPVEGRYAMRVPFALTR